MSRKYEARMDKCLVLVEASVDLLVMSMTAALSTYRWNVAGEAASSDRVVHSGSASWQPVTAAMSSHSA